MRFRAFSIAATLVGLAAASLSAGRAAGAAPDDSGEAELRAMLAQETAVATKTKVNSDFVPGVVTVLRGEDLEELGIETAWEALSLVPAIIPIRNAVGDPTVVVRGFEFPFSLKILIDGISLSRESAGINGIALQLPVQQIDRIEVIRGPSSVIYGDNAFLGLVNIVTRRRGERAYVRWGGDHAISGGPQVLENPGGGPWEVGAEGAAWKSEDAPVAEPLTADEKRAWGQAFVRYAGFSVTGEAITRRIDAAGPTGSLAPSEQTHAAIEGRWSGDPAAGLHAELHAAYLHNHFATSPTDFVGGLATYGADLTWTGWKRHAIVLALQDEHGTIDEASQQIPPPPPPIPPPPPLVIADRIRDEFGATLQDTFQVSDALSVTGGLRFDHFSDVGDRTTPRLSLVWQLSDSHIVKLQYAEGFRAPTFFELYANGERNPDLKPEVNRTGELSWIFRRPATVVRATLFRMRIEDVIYPDLLGAPPPVFNNAHHARAQGVELEWDQQIGARLRLLANVSYTDPRDNRTADRQERIPEVASKWTGNLAAFWRVLPSTHVSVRWNHVGDRNAASPADNSGYDLVDLTVARRDLFLRGLALEAGVKNVFDDDLRYLFPGRPGEASAFLRFPGRTYFAQVSWSR